MGQNRIYGCLLDVSINTARYRDKEEKQASLVVSYTDITQIRKVEQELRFARDSVKSIINSMPSILIGVDDKAMITQWNIEAEKITWIPADHARGKSLTTVFPRLAGIIPNISKAIENQQVLFNILKNGTEAMSEAKVASPRFVIRYFLEQNMAAVEIQDNGPGIP